jgi:glycosyltransferase involved in cell wall biosynthesis
MREVEGAHVSTLRLCLAGNEPRQRPLFDALARHAEVLAELAFDDIDAITRWTAAVLAFSRPRSEWWGNYQMHPLIQRRRRLVLQRGLGRLPDVGDALLTWGSWFHPMAGQPRHLIPFFTYVDQSRSLQPLPGESPTPLTRRQRSHALQAATYNDAAGVFCFSEWARGQTIEAHPRVAAKVHRVGWGPCAVDLSKEARDPAREERVVLHVSNDFHRKGVDYLLATASRLHPLMPDVRFVVIGRDARGGDYRSTANVSFLGPIYDQAVLADWFRRASLFFLPHRFDRSPHVLVEAMSAGLPLVTSAQGGPLELVTGTGAGEAIPPGDVDGYLRALMKFLRDDVTRRSAGACAKALMKAEYTWEGVAARMVSLMSLALARPGRAGPG